MNDFTPEEVTKAEDRLVTVIGDHFNATKDRPLIDLIITSNTPYNTAFYVGVLYKLNSENFLDADEDFLTIIEELDGKFPGDRSTTNSPNYRSDDWCPLTQPSSTARPNTSSQHEPGLNK